MTATDSTPRPQELPVSWRAVTDWGFVGDTSVVSERRGLVIVGRTGDGRRVISPQIVAQVSERTWRDSSGGLFFLDGPAESGYAAWRAGQGWGPLPKLGKEGQP